MKRAIRKEMKEKRDGLSRQEMKERSQKVKENLFSLPEFRDARTVMFYASFGSEVRTDGMIKDAISMGKTVVLPVANVASGGHTMTPREVCNFPGDVHPGAYGIMEPLAPKCREVPVGKIALVIVPGTAFDAKGERVGYGKGYYDRFLAKVPKATAIGLAYDFQVLPEACITREEHDAKVSMVVTDKRIVRC
jgi:5-formyltetrahydrofolate cyclo-ligase